MLVELLIDILPLGSHEPTRTAEGVRYPVRFSVHLNIDDRFRWRRLDIPIVGIRDAIAAADRLDFIWLFASTEGDGKFNTCGKMLIVSEIMNCPSIDLLQERMIDVVQAVIA